MLSPAARRVAPERSSASTSRASRSIDRESSDARSSRLADCPSTRVYSIRGTPTGAWPGSRRASAGSSRAPARRRRRRRAGPRRRRARARRGRSGRRTRSASATAAGSGPAGPSQGKVGVIGTNGRADGSRQRPALGELRVDLLGADDRDGDDRRAGAQRDLDEPAAAEALQPVALARTACRSP